MANRNRLELLSAQETARSDPTRPLIRGLDNSVLVALGGIVVILLIGSYYLPAFLSPGYLLLQLRIAAFLGIVAAGQMLVILLGHIDLSIPWTMTVAAMTATTLAGHGRTVGRAGDPARPRGRYRGGPVQRRWAWRTSDCHR